jgi:hypothetical protein
MEYTIIAMATAFLAGVTTLVIITYRRDCREMRKAVERLANAGVELCESPRQLCTSLPGASPETLDHDPTRYVLNRQTENGAQTSRTNVPGVDLTTSARPSEWRDTRYRIWVTTDGRRTHGEPLASWERTRLLWV